MQKRLLNFVILTLIVLGVTPAAHAQSFCAYIFSDIEMRSSVIPVFTPGTSKQGPVITYLTRYGKAVRKGDQFLIQGQKQSIESWGRDSDGNDFVALMDDQGHVHNESLNIFPKRAFALRQLSLDELMTYQNELVVDRIL
ncbi:MAG TPA: hypothetical protein VN132_13215, partial [Bdellovibrio sp.]|nr:hypothetical protein [Bdellovibrio sp.]